jgi:PAT family beta-lactamase induction signal transducer AmpG
VATPTPTHSPADTERKTPPRSALWVSTTYFAEGYPYSIVNNLAEVLFRELGASLRLVGLTALFHLPWNLKFLWGPVLDRYETKRRWLLGVEVVLTVLLGALALMVAGHGPLGWLAALFIVLGFAAATHDIAIDGFYLEGLDDRAQSRFVGVRAMAYKVASLLVRGPLLIVIGWIGWTRGLVAAALVMLGLTLVHFAILPRIEQPGRRLGELGAVLRRPATLLGLGLVAALAALEHQFGLGWEAIRRVRGALARVPWLERIPLAGWIGLGLLGGLLVLLALRRGLGRRRSSRDSFYAKAFLDFLGQAKVGRILAFVVLFRAGESFLQKMRWPFLRDVLGMSLETYGITNGTIGVIASFVGTLVGGALIARHGLRRWIWPCTLAQNLLTLLYLGLAVRAGSAVPGLGLVTAVITIEHFGEGVGTAVLMVYLMRCCDPGHKAAHMALLTALMSLGFTLAGGVSGFLVEAFGFVWYFGLSFAATIPAMVLIPLLPYLDGRSPPAGVATARG